MQKCENIANFSIFCLKPLAVAKASINYQTVSCNLYQSTDQCKNVKILPTLAASAWNLSL